MGTCVVEKIPIARIVLRRTDDKPATAFVSTYADADKVLKRWLEPAKGSSADVCEYELTFEDRTVVNGRLQVRRAIGGLSFQMELRDQLKKEAHTEVQCDSPEYALATKARGLLRKYEV